MTKAISLTDKKAKTNHLLDDSKDIVVNGDAIDHIESLMNLKRVDSDDLSKSRTTTPGNDPFSRLMDESFNNSTRDDFNKYISPFLMRKNPNVTSANQVLDDTKHEMPLENGKFKKSFKNPEVIGRGSFGQVWRCIHKLDNRPYAVKRIELEEYDESDVMNSLVFREVSAMSAIHHKNIVRFITCWLENEVVELADCKGENGSDLDMGDTEYS